MCLNHTTFSIHRTHETKSHEKKTNNPLFQKIFASMKIVVFVSGGPNLGVQCTPVTVRAVT